MYGNLLHLGDLVSVCLLGRCEATGPCGRILYKGAGKRQLASVGITDSVGSARIGNTAYVVDTVAKTGSLVISCHYLSVSVAHYLNVYPLIGRGRVSVIRPEESAYFHLLSGRRQLLDIIGAYLYYLTGAQLATVLISQLLISKGFECDRVSVFVLSDQDRESAKSVACGDNIAALLQNENFIPSAKLSF